MTAVIVRKQATAPAVTPRRRAFEFVIMVESVIFLSPEDVGLWCSAA
jgi:hypothetical protein